LVKIKTTTAVRHTVLTILFFLVLANACAQKNSTKPPQVSAAELKADSFNLKARAYLFKGKKDSALYCLDRAMELAKANNSDIMLARCYVDYANYFFMQARYNIAVQYMRSAEPYLDRITHYQIKINALLTKAGLYSFTGKKDSAIMIFQVAEQYNNVHNPYRNWVLYMSMAELFNQLKDDVQADAYYQKAYRLTSGAEHILDRGHLLAAMINYYRGKNNYEASAPLIAEFYTLVEQRKKKNINDPLEDLIMKFVMGRLENDIGFMKSVKATSLQKGDLSEALIANGYMIAYYEKKNDHAQALALADEGVLLAGKTGNIENRYGAQKIKYDLLQKTGDFAGAAKEAAMLFELKDSLLTVQKREKIYELETKFDTEKKQREIALLTLQQKVSEKSLALLSSDKKMAELLLQQEMIKRSAADMENLLMDSVVRSEQAYSEALNRENHLKTAELENAMALKSSLNRENELKSNQLKKERATKWGFATGAGLLLLSGIAILAMYRRQRSANSIISRQSADLEVLMKEIHHRVKNNLQVVSSLLDLQSHTITDTQASAAVKEGKNRVQSMALIHQNLYSEGNIKGIKVKEYIQNLVQTLCDSYNITNDKVKVSANIDDLNLDVDTMIPLGLVLNELVSNSFKYAFTEDKKGTLDILLEEKDDKLHLMVSDNGIGFPADMNIKSAKSFGLKMIRAFAQKLKASLDIYNNNGAVVEMQITKYKTA
jgi:two-component sensor histidine kinase